MSNKLKLHWLLLLFSFVVTAQDKTEVFFDFNADHLNEEATTNFLNWLNEHQNIEINKLAGYCDSVDTDSYNRDLSFRRIQSILKILKENNSVINRNIITKPYGERFTQSGIQAENRKVTIYYTVAGTPKTTANNIIKQEERKTEKEKPEAITISLKEKFKKAKKGDLIKLQNINFEFNSEKIMQDSEHVLTELWQVLVDNPKLKIEIQGHICCNPNPNDTKLSYRRARYILGWLLKKDIDLNRLSFIGYGSSRPLYPIPEKNYNEEVANRRVEILIIEKE